MTKLTLALESHLRGVEAIYYLIVDYMLIQLLWVFVVKLVYCGELTIIAHFFGLKFLNLNLDSAGNSCCSSDQSQSFQYCCLFGYSKRFRLLFGYFDCKVDVFVKFFSLLKSLNCVIFECLKTGSYLKSILICYLWAAFLLNS